MRKENMSHDWSRNSSPRRNGRDGFVRRSHTSRDNDRKQREGKSFKTKDRDFDKQDKDFRNKNRDFKRKDQDFRNKDRNFKDKNRSFKDRDRDFKSRDRGFNQDRKRFSNDRGPSKTFGRKFDRNREEKTYRKRAYEQYKEENGLTEPRFVEQVQPKKEEGDIRLNKYIANAGICSRREADVLITTGVITVNGEVITQLGYKVKQGDVVKYNGKTLNNEKKVYILLNKPKGYITTSDDPQQRKTVFELIDGACKERVYPVGRLDRNTTGLLLFTNDGDLTKKLTHPSFGAQKVYNVELDKPLTKSDMDQLLEGVELEDGIQRVDDINYLNNQPLDKKKIGVSIHSGKNRIIRRLFEALGYEVKKLDRVYFAGLTKKNLLRGQYRFLDNKEIGFLHMQR